MPALQFFEIRWWLGKHGWGLRTQDMLVDPQHRFTRENQRALDYIFQFTNIAGPRVSHQLFQRFLIDVFARTSELHAILFQEMSSQERDILRAISEWRYAEWKNIQTVKEIGAKCAVFDGGR